MNRWNQISVVRLLFPFLGGILATVYFQLRLPYPLCFLGSVLLLFVFLSEIKSPKWNYQLRWLQGTVISFLFFLMGVQLTHSATEMESPKHYSKSLQSKNFVIAMLNEAPLNKGKTLKTEIAIKAIHTNGNWKEANGRAMLYMEPDQESSVLHYGDELLLEIGLTPVPPPQNPAEFNYQRYLQFHQIHYQAYAKRENWKNLNRNEGNVILKTCLRLRNYLLSVLIENGVQGNEFAVGSALILGYEDKLNSEIMNAYSASGALHVLSVSGLHIAIVFLVLNQALFFLEKFKRGQVLKASILILLLWFYAALTGLSPSVLRSAAMFSLLIVGKSLNRYTNIYNTLAASMLALLIWNPYLIMDVGFQLSYLAVLGIVSIQDGLYSRWQPKSKLLDRIWAITSVSIAAQLSTFPLGLLYFHQFPNYFLISNLVVIPLSTLILYLGMAVCGVFKIKFLTLALCKFLSASLWFLNSSVSFFEKLPYSVIEGISITTVETWTIYATLFSFYLFFELQKIRFLRWGLLLTALLFLVLIQHKIERLRQQKIIVYRIKKHSAIDLIEGRNNYFFCDSGLIHNKSSLLFHVKHNWWDLGIEKTFAGQHTLLYAGAKAGNFRCRSNLIYFGHKKLLCLNPQNQHLLPYLQLSETIDLLIVSNNVKVNLSKLKAQLKFDKVIFDSSNSTQKIKYWKQQCEADGIPFYDVNKNGAFVEEL